MQWMLTPPSFPRMGGARQIMIQTVKEAMFAIIKNTTLKLVSAIFCQIFIFSPNDSPSKTMKNVFYFI